ncbi:uncharacterized protein MONBRDRAFT_25404 [Monosiga brevicollis MX1]|uniref:PDZ domain-containing protein n=1 Tax=Monosiga brevicollis TaxID=81824 RepID=A9UZB5_MONBE|nr:uncharacterized protein MONBRDRAFT_25404 [Monosiga brevicollis MX1]EDQ89339.1 predicted protein [Monosiga brevicollis MX1]|eukprot:XP_001745915.1 hypothetical protein [Monosiga brevicollis MX1]
MFTTPVVTLYFPPVINPNIHHTLTSPKNNRHKVKEANPHLSLNLLSLSSVSLSSLSLSLSSSLSLSLSLSSSLSLSLLSLLSLSSLLSLYFLNFQHPIHTHMATFDEPSTNFVRPLPAAGLDAHAYLSCPSSLSTFHQRYITPVLQPRDPAQRILVREGDSDPSPSPKKHDKNKPRRNYLKPWQQDPDAIRRKKERKPTKWQPPTRKTDLDRHATQLRDHPPVVNPVVVQEHRPATTPTKLWKRNHSTSRPGSSANLFGSPPRAIPNTPPSQERIMGSFTPSMPSRSFLRDYGHPPAPAPTSSGAPASSTSNSALVTPRRTRRLVRAATPQEKSRTESRRESAGRHRTPDLNPQPAPTEPRQDLNDRPRMSVFERLSKPKFFPQAFRQRRRDKDAAANTPSPGQPSPRRQQPEDMPSVAEQQLAQSAKRSRSKAARASVFDRLTNPKMFPARHRRRLEEIEARKQQFVPSTPPHVLGHVHAVPLTHHFQPIFVFRVAEQERSAASSVASARGSKATRKDRKRTAQKPSHQPESRSVNSSSNTASEKAPTPRHAWGSVDAPAASEDSLASPLPVTVSRRTRDQPGPSEPGTPFVKSLDAALASVQTPGANSSFNNIRSINGGGNGRRARTFEPEPSDSRRVAAIQPPRMESPTLTDPSNLSLPDTEAEASTQLSYSVMRQSEEKRDNVMRSHRDTGASSPDMPQMTVQDVRQDSGATTPRERGQATARAKTEEILARARERSLSRRSRREDSGSAQGQGASESEPVPFGSAKVPQTMQYLLRGSTADEADQVDHLISPQASDVHEAPATDATSVAREHEAQRELEAQQQRLELEAAAERERLEAMERSRLEEEAALAQAERERLEKEEEQRQHAEAERLRQKAAEAERQRQEAAEAEAEAERQRQEAAEAERQRQEAAEAEAERQRQETAEAEAERQRQEAAEAEAEAERQRQEAAEAERQRQETAEAEAERQRQEAAEAEAERQRQEAAEAEAERQRQEAAEAEAERQRQETAEAEAERQRQEAAEAEAERQREEAAEAEAERQRQEAAEAEAERQRQEAAEAEAERKRQEEAETERRRQAEAERQRKLAEDIERRRKEQQAEAMRKKQAAEAEAERQRQEAEAAEAAARQKQAAEAAARQKQAEEEAEAERRRQAEAERQRKLAEDIERRRKEQEAERLAESRRREQEAQQRAKEATATAATPAPALLEETEVTLTEEASGDTAGSVDLATPSTAAAAKPASGNNVQALLDAARRRRLERAATSNLTGSTDSLDAPGTPPINRARTYAEPSDKGVATPEAGQARSGASTPGFFTPIASTSTSVYATPATATATRPALAGMGNASVPSTSSPVPTTSTNSTPAASGSATPVPPSTSGDNGEAATDRISRLLADARRRRQERSQALPNAASDVGSDVQSEVSDAPSSTTGSSKEDTPRDFRIVKPAIGSLGFILGSSDGSTGLRIKSLTPASVAQRAGLAVGDVLVAIDGQATSTMTVAEAGALIKAVQPEQAVTVTVSRPSL